MAELALATLTYFLSLAFVAYLYLCHRLHPIWAALLYGSTIFASHALVALIHGVSGEPDGGVVYASLPELRSVHQVMGGVPVVFMFALAAWRIWNGHRPKTQLLLAILVPVAILGAGLLITGRAPSQDSVSAVAFFLLVLAVPTVMSMDFAEDSNALAYGCFLGLAGLSLVIGFSEILFAKVRAATIYPTSDADAGYYVAYRASGLFGNANWYGLWAAMLIVTSIWIYGRRKMVALALAGIILGATGIYLSGSRGAAIAAIVLMGLYVVLAWKTLRNRALFAAALAVLVFVLLDLAVVAANFLFPASAAGNFYGLHYRWVSGTFDLVQTWITFASGGPVSKFSGPAAQSTLGRIGGDGADSGFAALTEISPFGVLSLVPITAYILWMSLWRFISHKRQSLSAVVLIVAATVLLPIQLRAFTVYPIWLLEATLIGLAMFLVSGERGQLARYLVLRDT